MKITVIGTGYVGLVSGVCYAKLGHDVICVDKDSAKIDKLLAGEVPIYEPGLKDLIAEVTESGNLNFTTRLDYAVKQSEMIILAVGTPQLPNGEANLSYIDQAAKEIHRTEFELSQAGTAAKNIEHVEISRRCMDTDRHAQVAGFVIYGIKIRIGGQLVAFDAADENAAGAVGFC